MNIRINKKQYIENMIPKLPEQIKIDIDSIITRLLQVKNKKPGLMVQLKQQEILGIANKAKNIFQHQPILLNINAPIKVCGDIHGQYVDMLRMFQYGGFPPNSSYLFLGDYVDRGRQGIQSICLLFSYKIKYPHKIYILRGNHQSQSITRIYGFFQQCKNRYSLKIWKSFVNCFNFMPVAALVQQKILCMHGGLSPDITSTEDINKIIRPTDIPDNGPLCDILWSDPDSNIRGWDQSQRGVSYIFGGDVVTNFLRKNDLDLICRAHQVVQDGYQFFNQKQLVTVFSAPNYCGEFNNSGAMMCIDQNLSCCFQVLRPHERYKAIKNGKNRVPIKRGGE